MKCSECDGKGFTSLGEGIRGVKKCSTCRGKGEIVERLENRRIDDLFEYLGLLIDLRNIDEEYLCTQEIGECINEIRAELEVGLFRYKDLHDVDKASKRLK